MRSSNALEIAATARCGRCASILPDETLSYCPQCGVVFSNVPPTTSYTELSQHALEQSLKFERVRFALMVSFVFALLLGVLGLIAQGYHEVQVAHLQGTRKIMVTRVDLPGFPTVSDSVARISIGIGIQAFEDHFGIALPDVEIKQNAPDELKALLADNSSQISLLSHWEKNVYPKLTKQWARNAEQPLWVLITNAPIFTDGKEVSQIDTRHLGPSGLVSGLGHPALVLISTFRMNNQSPDSPQFANDIERTRYLGEYLMAHELGHALLGLEDYVVEPRETSTKLRAPASVGSTRSSKLAPEILDTCLMHTDQGGGTAAWKTLRERHLGEVSACHAYQQQTEAFQLRLKAIQELKAGHREFAEALHNQAIAKARGNSQAWVAAIWEDEHPLFVSFFQRMTLSWTKPMFVFE